MAHAAIGLGTLSGGWRIIHTMGSKITKLQPVQRIRGRDGRRLRDFRWRRCSAFRVSTTHAITGSIVGRRIDRRLSAVRWGVAGQIVWAWVLTIPAAAGLAAAMFYLLRVLGIR